MLIGATLGRYFSLRFLRMIMLVFGTVFALVYTIDFVELMRRAGDAEGASAGLMAQLALFRTPAVAEQVLPFAVLFGSMATLLQLSRKLELVVARAAGVSAWQFLQPGLLVAFLIGVLSITAYNPVSALLRQQASAIEARIFAKTAGPTARDIWIRQRSTDGQAIIRAEGAIGGTATITGVTMFTFDEAGAFAQRIEAREATLHDGHWALKEARVLTAEEQPQSFAAYQVAGQAELHPGRCGAVLEPRRDDRPDRTGGTQCNRLPAPIRRAPGPPAPVRRHGFRGRIGFVKILPVWWRGDHGSRWRRRRLHALCRDGTDGGPRRLRAHRPGGGGLVPGSGG
jgi:LPS export ABC transporter permease LptG